MDTLESDPQDSTGYRDESTLRELYKERGMDMSTIADHFGVSKSTIHRWLNEYDIETRDSYTPDKQGYAGFHTDIYGYERWKDRDLGHHTTVRVHQLVLIASGEDPFEVYDSSNHVHHINEVTWDNRPENITLLSNSEHISTHKKGEDNHNSKLTEEQVREIRVRLHKGESSYSIAESYPVGDDTIRMIGRGELWSHVE